MNIINQKFEIEYTFDIQFTNDLFKIDNPLLADFFRYHNTSNDQAKILFIIDSNVNKLHDQLQAKIRAYFETIPGISLASILILPGGEEVKNNSRYLEQVLTAVNNDGIDRHSYIAGIGGGAILDMVGYAAAIAHRGIRHIRIPTTVLSQNDSGIGVKNSINYFGKKNFLGTFVPPVAVFNDALFLTTLNDRDWRSGMSEAVKVALIKDKIFFDWLLENADSLRKRESKPMEYLIFKCAQLHNDHIASGDPFESGSARPLDFGHWLAHKLEYLTHFQLRHGEAVAIGIALDSIYSHRIGLISETDQDQILELLTKLGFSLSHPQLNQQDKLLEGLIEFKEHLGGQLTITLLSAIGIGLEVHEINTDVMKESINSLLQNYPD
ncbi:3-dehydroquinate synthase [Membranihabitans marinus]|uniref:3-dehydroquinate synthase n=1 Tax=Membranihabitans marinus TaxID=1227546 RepID=UPI001F2AD98E|nr:3-dehydroquinate synthase [Membranihabitans marinus]